MSKNDGKLNFDYDFLKLLVLLQVEKSWKLISVYVRLLGAI